MLRHDTNFDVHRKPSDTVVHPLGLASGVSSQVENLTKRMANATVKPGHQSHQDHANGAPCHTMLHCFSSFIDSVWLIWAGLG